MDYVNIELSEVYSVEHKLRKKTVDEYKALGIERLLEEVHKHAFCESRTSTESVIYELVDGCHRSRALLDLGYSGRVSIRVSIEYEGLPEILLREAPVLEEEEYIKWLREEDRNGL